MSRAPEPAKDAIGRAAAIIVSDPDALTSAELRAVLRLLIGFMRARYPWLSEFALEDIATDAIARVLTGARTGSIKPDGNPGGYLIRTAQNLAIDRMRATQREELVEPSRMPERISDDAAAAAIESAAVADVGVAAGPADEIRRGLAKAAARGDDTACRVVAYLLDEVQTTGQMPTNREAGEELDLSHTAVSDALRRFRSYLR